MSKAYGTPLQRTWKDSEKDELNISHEQKTKILFQLGVITWQLSRLSFDQAGSLFEEDGEFQIKPCLSRGLLLDERHSLGDINRGPFKSEKDYYEAHDSAFLEHVKYLQLDHHCFFAPIPARSEYDDYAGFRKASDWWSDFVTVQSKIDGSDNRTDYVIAKEALSEIITRWTNKSDFPLNDRRHRFSIHHPDFSVDNIFVDEGFNITCIIDWAFCSSVPLSVLLTAPGLPQSRDEVDVSLLPAFENGFRHALQKNTQRDNIETEMTLYRMLSCSRPIWLLSRILNFDSTTDYHLFKALWDSMGKNHDQGISEFFRSRQSSQQYILLRNELREDDQTREKVDRREKEYFRDDIQRLAIARKLTLVSQWSLRYHESSLTYGIRRNNSNIFVADKTLWKWIDSCLKA